MNPSTLSSFTANRPHSSEPVDVTLYCIFFVLTVLCFWKFQACARLYRNFVRYTTEDTRADQRQAKLLEFLFLGLTCVFFGMLCQGDTGFIFGSLNVITFCVFVYIYVENMGYLPDSIQPANREIDRGKLLTLYERKKVELPLYINEVALYKFVLERQTYTPVERKEFMDKYVKACCQCSKAIQDLDNLVCDLELENRYEAHTYMEQYKQYGELVYKTPRMPFFELNYN
jgi:hypothetical protein